MAALRTAVLGLCLAGLAALAACDAKKAPSPSSPPKPSTEASGPVTGR